jgi:hypothetical protein
MGKLEKLTPEQEKKMLEVRDFWKDYIHSCKHNIIDKSKAKQGIDFIYKLTGKKEPVVVYVDSPMGCQLGIMYLKEFFRQSPKKLGASVWNSVGDSVGASVRDSVWDSVGASVRASVGASVWASVGASVWASVWASVGDSVRASVGASVWASVWDSVGDSVGASVRASVGASVGASVRDSVGASVWDSVKKSGIPWNDFSAYGSILDYGWVSFYDFFTQIGVVNHEKFNQFRELLLSGVYDMIQLEGFCVVSSLPIVLHKNANDRLHCENGPAIAWKDGFELYYWNGINVPKEWIMNTSCITKDMVLKETNAEKRRTMKEIIGVEKFIKLLDVSVIDEDTDEHKLPMKLLKSKTKDVVFNDYWYFLNVTCPSTLREYFISVRPTDNVWKAKASTFQDKKIQVRHGDVGLLNLKEIFERPLIET